MQSIFTDCPHREKLGWLADMIQSMGAIHSNFDVSGMLREMERNMLESQQPGGLVPGTAPEFPNFGGGYRDDVNWGGAFIITPYFLWQTYGDTRTMREYYGAMQDYLAYVRAQISGGLLVSGLGDWIAGDTTTPKEATGTYGLWVIADRMAQMAAFMGKDADAADYRGLATSLGAPSTPRSMTRRRRPTARRAARHRHSTRCPWRWGSCRTTRSSPCSTTSSRASTPITPADQGWVGTYPAARSRCSRSTRC